MLIHMDGFDVYAQASDLSFQYTLLGGFQLGTTSGRFGQGSIQGGGSDGMERLFNRTYTDIWTGFAFLSYDPGGLGPSAFSPTGIRGDATVCGFASAVGAEGYVLCNNLMGTWKFFTPSYTYYPGSSAVYPMNVNNWHWIDIHYVPNTASGTFELWIDGNQIINLTSVPTSINQNNIISVFLGGAAAFNSPACIQGSWDDWYILDSTTGPYNTTRLGDSRIYTLIPNGDAGPNDGVPLTPGPHYDMVHESQNDGLLTYVTIQGIAGQEELYTMSSLPTQPSTIWGTRVLNIVEQTAGGVLNANAVVVSNGVVAQGNTQPILNVFFSQFGIFESDPNTNAAWTYSNVNLADCGIVIV